MSTEGKMERCKAITLRLGVFLLWLVTSFLCHKLAKAAMSVYSQDATMPASLLLPAGVTLSQMLMCWGMVQQARFRGHHHHHHLLIFSHTLATLATNTSMALTFASSTMAIKMLEPASSAVLQTVLLNSPMGWRRALSLLLVIGGAVMYVGSPLSDGKVALATVLAFLSNLVLGVRNVTLKLSQQQQQQQQEEEEDYSLRSRSSLLQTFLGCAVCLYVSYALEGVVKIFPPNVTYFLFLTLVSSFFHVTYSYVSTKIVLSYMSVVSHAVANIFKRVLVVLLLHVTGQRLASAWNWTGLALSFTGLCLYQRYKTTSATGDATTLQKCNIEGSAAQRKIPKPTLKSLRRLLLLLMVPYFVCIVLTMVNVTAMPTRILFATSWNSMTVSQFLGAMFGGNTNTTVSTDLFGPNAIEWNESMYDAAPFPFPLHPTGSQMSKPTFSVVLSMSSNQLYSKFLKVERHLSAEVLNTTDYARSLLLGLQKWRDGQLLINQDLGFQPTWKPLQMVREFLRSKPLEQPFDTDSLSPYLTASHGVIAEAHRVHLSLFRHLLAGKKYAILFGLASFENKGDPAISVAEAVLLAKLGIELIFYVNVSKCNGKSVNKSLAIAGRYPAEKVVILMSGGGNLIGYKTEDNCRKLAMKHFKTYQQVIFSESIYMRASKSNFESAIAMYCCNSNLTILLRDRQSLLIGKRIFNNGTRLVLAPDIAFQNGPVRRYIPPYYDVMWLYRKDGEKPDNTSFRFPPNIRVGKGDWMSIPSLNGNTSFQKAVNILLNGYDILQRGRVVITERLHGHILCVLLDIPHVLLDNSDLKLSSYYNTWTRGLSNCRLASSAPQAGDLAMELLQKYNHSLPSLLSAAHIQN